MSVQNETAHSGGTTVLAKPISNSVYSSLFEKINLSPVSTLSNLNVWQDNQSMSDASADERTTAAMQVSLERLVQSSTRVEKLDKHLVDHHIAQFDQQISCQLDAVMHHDEFQKVESVWRGLKSLVDKTDFRHNVKIELLDISKDDLRQDFEDAPEIIQSGLYLQTYVAGYGTPDATASSRINARLPYIFLLSRIAHYLKLIQRENIGTTRDRRLLELELNTWVKSLVTKMTDPGDELQASHPLRDAKVLVEDIEDNPGFFRVKLFAIPHFQVEGMDVNLSLVSQMPKAKS